jgi:hypothetical protein
MTAFGDMPTSCGRLKLPYTCRSRYPPGSAQSGGERTFSAMANLTWRSGKNYRCFAEYVEDLEGIRPAQRRAWAKVEKGMVGFVNGKADHRTRVTTVRFSSRES